MADGHIYGAAAAGHSQPVERAMGSGQWGCTAAKKKKMSMVQSVAEWEGAFLLAR